MKYIFSIMVLSGAMLFVGLSCRSSKKAQSESSFEGMSVAAQAIVPDTFVLPHLPETMKNPEARAKYLAMHYWDRYDFSDRNLINRSEITEQAFVDYINTLNYVPEENRDASLEYTLRKAETDTVVYRHFVMLFEKYLYDPNSPFRNEEIYLPVLRETVRSPLMTEEDRSRLQFRLDMAMKNRVGGKANDFIFTYPSGKSNRLYDLKSEYILLMFTDPGCSSCVITTDRLSNSAELNNALRLNTPGRTMLTVLALYPENDVEEWRAYLSEMPANWLHAYDKSQEINNKKLYDIRALPTLYLLDREKKVILKDVSVEAIESYFSIR